MFAVLLRNTDACAILDLCSVRRRAERLLFVFTRWLFYIRPTVLATPWDFDWRMEAARKFLGKPLNGVGGGDRENDGGRGGGGYRGGVGGGQGGEKGIERVGWTEREGSRENSNSKTLFYK